MVVSVWEKVIETICVKMIFAYIPKLYVIVNCCAVENNLFHNCNLKFVVKINKNIESEYTHIIIMYFINV